MDLPKYWINMDEFIDLFGHELEDLIREKLHSRLEYFNTCEQLLEQIKGIMPGKHFKMLVKKIKDITSREYKGEQHIDGIRSDVPPLQNDFDVIWKAKQPTALTNIQLETTGWKPFDTYSLHVIHYLRALNGDVLTKKKRILFDHVPFKELGEHKEFGVFYNYFAKGIDKFKPGDELHFTVHNTSGNSRQLYLDIEYLVPQPPPKPKPPPDPPPKPKPPKPIPHNPTKPFDPTDPYRPVKPPDPTKPIDPGSVLPKQGATAIFLDVSGSMRKILTQMSLYMQSFLSSLSDTDRVTICFVAGYDEEFYAPKYPFIRNDFANKTQAIQFMSNISNIPINHVGGHYDIVTLKSAIDYHMTDYDNYVFCTDQIFEISPDPRIFRPDMLKFLKEKNAYTIPTDMYNRMYWKNEFDETGFFKPLF